MAVEMLALLLLFVNPRVQMSAAQRLAIQTEFCRGFPQ